MRLARALACAAALLLAWPAAAAPDRLPKITYPYSDQGEFWVNSEPLSDQQVHDQPVLLMFWTYGCSNCKASLAWINSVHERMADKGLLVLGVHSPEFDYERDKDSVRANTAKLGIEFPVMIDNDFTFWKEMRNRWWPTFYIVDRGGRVLAAYIGETHLDTPKAEEIEGKLLGLLDR